MNILAFDTSGESCSVALKTEQHCFEKINNEPRKQAERLLPMIDELLVDAGLKRQDLQGLALTHGPGAFTGLRVAISAAQGLAYALDLPVVSVSTLAALAQGSYRKEGWQHVLTAVDARMQEVYWGAYELQDGLMQAVIEDRVASPEQVDSPLHRELGWYGSGSAWAIYADKLPQVHGYNTFSIEAFDIISLALPAFLKGKTISADKILPLYLRDKVVH